ncbi:HAMP domain-containing sensor histidine kinase [Nocardioides caricicola]|uniref:histidine kinase n=1 Tax=Nocardioides caricicola TaxID=634770 RepID=A0ABW0N2F0_9ACTN
MRRAFASLTSRLVLTTVLLILVVSVLLGAATTVAMKSYLDDRLDEQVHQLPIGSGPTGGPGMEVGMVRALISEDGTAEVYVVEPRSAEEPIRQVQLDDAAADELAKVPTDRETHTVSLPGIGDFRVQAIPTPDGGTYLVGLPEDSVSSVLERLVSLELLFAVIATALGGGVALVVVRRQLRPLREVAETAHAVAALPLASGAIDLTERVPEHLTDERTEVGQVGAALNALLAHVETSLDARHRSEQQVRQFVADASHELRSPLATIAGYTELARRRPDDAAATATALHKVEEESGRMTALVEDLLLLARLDSGRPLEQEPVDLTRLLLEAVSDARVVAPDHHWRLDVPDDAVETPYEVLGDDLRLHQVATNLLSNAARYTPAGTTVTVRVRRDGFSVHDDGPGFAPDLVDHAFERFARGDAARTRGAEVGVGLGLSLVEAIVSAHGGTVTLRSVPGDTTLDVRLPARPG